jgi:hypothetical protein
MNTIIVIAGILVGIGTYNGMEEDPTIAKLDSIILVIFTFECFMKILSDPLRPWKYFTGENAGWNNFDFLIVLACMPFMPFGSAAAAMRLLRLMRVLKLLSSNPQLRMILVGLVAGTYTHPPLQPPTLRPPHPLSTHHNTQVSRVPSGSSF